MNTACVNGQRGRLFIAVFVVFAMALALLPSSAAAAADTTPPTLVAFDLVPKTVDVSGSSAQVSVTMRITDDSSGTVMPNVVFSSQDTSQSTGFATVTRISGTALDGVYRAVGTLPVGAAPGAWRAVLYPLEDVAGNSGTFGPGSAFPHTFTVTSTNDDAPPEDGPDDPPFSDIAGTTHQAAITAIVDAGITGGFSDGTYRPGANVTRGQMATFLTRALELQPWSGRADEVPFSDIAGTTHRESILSIVEAEITGGFSDGTYRPGADVSRGQMATFLTRGFDLPASDRQWFSDTPGTTHEQSIGAVAAAEITGGFSDGTYRPGANVTRGQMATFLARALDLI